MKTRRDFLKGISLGAAGFVVPRIAAAAPVRSRKPNIIIILADDLGYADLSCYGHKTIKTPNIDAMARGGLKFTDFHSNGAVCSPTRAALLTGRYQQRCGVTGVVTASRHREVGMAIDETTFAEVLGRTGYATGIFGKWHVGYAPKFNPTKQGFDEYVGFVSGNVDYHAHVDQVGYLDWWKRDKIENEKGYITDLITNYGLKFIEKHKDKPFCLYLPHGAPHYPIQGRNTPPQRNVTRGPFAERGAGSRGPKGKTGKRKRAVNPRTRALYREMIEVMDEGVGRIVAKVRELGLEKDTLIVFMSDNGPARLGSAGPLRGRKGQIWEGGHRVPAVMYWPGKIKGPTTTGQTAMGIDLFATMVEMSGESLPDGVKLDGVSLL
ncbi:MAG: sulfatase-like hydrolase/transferase, partial [Planctomycetes bacterium]|nr:sulfatase-like hydrolase/transferase [Planctomycetota bacterium]